jgi:hypothetical protein
MWSK